MDDNGYEYGVLSGRLLRRHAVTVGNGDAWLVWRMVPDPENGLAVWEHVSRLDVPGLEEMLREPDLWSGANRAVDERTRQVRLAFGKWRSCDCSDCIDSRRAIIRDAGLVVAIPGGAK